MVDVKEFLYVLCKMRGNGEGCFAAARDVQIFLLTDNTEGNKDIENIKGFNLHIVTVVNSKALIIYSSIIYSLQHLQLNNIFRIFIMKIIRKKKKKKKITN